MNKIYSFTSILSFALLLCGCAASVDTAHIARMDSFIGQRERDIIMNWGVPDKSYDLDRRTKIISYRKESFYTDRATGFGVTTCAGSFGGTGIGYTGCIDPLPRPTRSYVTACEYNFTITGGKAVNWFQNGNGCPRIR